LKRVSKDEATITNSWFETRRKGGAPHHEDYLNRYHLFKKFSASPDRAQSIAINSPLPDSVM
jgi:hypothetical protein